MQGLRGIHDGKSVSFLWKVHANLPLIVRAAGKKSTRSNKTNLNTCENASELPPNKVHQSDFEVVPVPLNFCMHLQLLDLTRAVDVVGESVTPCVRMRSDEIPSAIQCQQLKT